MHRDAGLLPAEKQEAPPNSCGRPKPAAAAEKGDKKCSWFVWERLAPPQRPPLNSCTASIIATMFSTGVLHCTMWMELKM